MSKETALLKLKSVSKFYYNKGMVSSGFNKISLEFNLGEFVVITGESGSGKSTLLNVLSGLDTYEEGEMYINGEETSHYSESDFENYRKTYIGNIFQNFNLVNSYTVYQNIELVLLLNGYKKKDIHDKIIELIKKVDLYRFRKTRVSKLSGGQKQRVAIARALAKETPIIIADEPTGNLDSKSAKSVIKLLSDMAKDRLVVIVTHNYDQVEEYATRKIEMHDGKVREDIELKKYESNEAVVYNYDNITFFNKIRLGVRNTFNIIPKFLLMFAVFLFVTLSFLGEYSSFRKAEYEEKKIGYNSYFSNDDDKRIVLKKEDKSFFTDTELEKIEKINNVARVEKDDLLLDTMYTISDDYFYFNGSIENYDVLTSVDVGRLPEKDNEIVIKGYKYDYYLSGNKEDLFNAKLHLYSQNSGLLVTDDDLVVVGIKYNESSMYNRDVYYVSSKVIDKLRLNTNEQFANVVVEINESKTEVMPYDTFLHLVPNENILPGEALVSNDINYMCKYSWCKNNTMNITVNNLYYTENISLKITNMYTQYNFTSYTGLKNFEQYSGVIFISFDDYNSLYNKYTYQSSVFVDDVKNVDSVEKELKNMGMTTLKMKDAMGIDGEGVLEVIRLFKTIVTVILFIVMFFIAYFVIKIIQKSRNVYYSTVRILGGSKKVVKNLISIELYTIFNLAFILIMAFIILVRAGVINSTYITNLSTYLAIKDYILIYLLLFGISFLISFRYSRKLFKSSAMRAYNEEV